tara:strand:+ start:518 stop:697 length:180 start_codon:yes stop_codon:yes gene_type:complete
MTVAEEIIWSMGYAAYWDGYDQFCMGGFFNGIEYFWFNRGFGVGLLENNAKAIQTNLGI